MDIPLSMMVFSSVTFFGVKPSFTRLSLKLSLIAWKDPNIRVRCLSSERFRTNVPFPLIRLAQPCSSTSKRLFLAVVLLILYILISSFSEGTLSPGNNSPASIFAIIALLISIYFGLLFFIFLLDSCIEKDFMH